MILYQAERFVATQMELGECPVWDAARGTLYWMDIIGKQLHAYHWSSGRGDRTALPALGGGLALACNDMLIAGLQTGVHRLDPQCGKWDLIATPEPEKPDNRINEMKCDPQGRIWFGTMSTLGRVPTGALWRMDRSGVLTRIFDSITVPNCLAWVPSQDRFLFADSVLKTIWICHYDPTSGDIIGRSIFADCKSYRGIPDGCAFDEEGCVWIAEFGGGCVRRYDLTGRILATVTVPATQVTTCCFAGARLDKLVIVTAKRLLDDEQRKQQPESGNVFVCEPGVRGARTAMADLQILDLGRDQRVAAVH